jgi:hypothetical protein
VPFWLVMTFFFVAKILDFLEGLELVDFWEFTDIFEMIGFLGIIGFFGFLVITSQNVTYAEDFGHLWFFKKPGFLNVRTVFFWYVFVRFL